MDNTNILLAANIQTFRKKAGLTQEELADQLGVTFQAVSKWENAKSAPDIFFLPVMADLFGCYIDELFSREVIIEKHYDRCSEFPWPDDTVIRGIVCEGRKILQVTDGMVDKFTFEITGDVKSVSSECNIVINGSVTDGCVSKGNLIIGGHLTGGCSCKGDVTVGGHFSDGCACSGNLTCGGDLSGDIKCAGTISVAGNVKSGKIEGSVTCNSVECEWIKGDVTISPKE